MANAVRTLISSRAQLGVVYRILVQRPVSISGIRLIDEDEVTEGVEVRPVQQPRVHHRQTRPAERDGRRYEADREHCTSVSRDKDKLARTPRPSPRGASPPSIDMRRSTNSVDPASGPTGEAPVASPYRPFFRADISRSRRRPNHHAAIAMAMAARECATYALLGSLGTTPTRRGRVERRYGTHAADVERLSLAAGSLACFAAGLLGRSWRPARLFSLLGSRWPPPHMRRSHRSLLRLAVLAVSSVLMLFVLEQFRPAAVALVLDAVMGATAAAAVTAALDGSAESCRWR